MSLSPLAQRLLLRNHYDATVRLKSEADQALATVEAQLQEAMSGNQNPLQYATDPRMKSLVQAKVSAGKAISALNGTKTAITSWSDDHGYLKDTATDIQVRCDGAVRDCKAVATISKIIVNLKQSVEKDSQHVAELLREVDKAYADEEASGIGIPEMLSRMEVLEKYLRELGEGLGALRTVAGGLVFQTRTEALTDCVGELQGAVGKLKMFADNISG